MWIRSILVSCALALLVPGTALSDGAVFNASFRPLRENEQRAAIVFRDGVQRMVLAINYDIDQSDEAIWIFPVPSAPDQTKIDVIDSFPRFSGRSVQSRAKRRLSALMMYARFTQIYPMLVEPVYVLLNAKATRHVEVDKHGIHAEIVTAESVDALAQYLVEQWPQVVDADLSVFQPYFSDQYSLVLVRISSVETLVRDFSTFSSPGSRWPCLYVEFATDRIFFPLRPTSIYGRVRVPVQLYIGGYVEPESASHLSAHMRLSHCIDMYDKPSWNDAEGRLPDELRKELSGTFRYTDIRLSVEADQFTEDWWFSAPQTQGPTYSEFLISVDEDYLLVAAIPVIVVCSYLAGGIAGLVVMRKWQGFARLGLWNILTLLALYLVLRIGAGTAARELHAKRGKFIVVFTVVYVGLTIAVQMVLMAPI